MSIEFHQKSAYLMAGFPGSGKSTLARKVADHVQAEYLSTDQMRQELFNSSRFDDRGDEGVVKLREEIYPLMYARAASLIKNNQKVVIDASHMDVPLRKPALEQLTEEISPHQLCFIVVNTPVTTIRQRMQQFANQANDGTDETMFEAWERVYNIFLDRQKRGLIAWPSPEEGIDIYQHEDINTLLA